MKKGLIVFTILLLSACSKSSEIENCRYNYIAQSYVKPVEINECVAIYKEIESAKSKSNVNKELILDGYSILIHFDFVENESEDYIVNSDGTLLFDVEDTHYSVMMSKEFYIQLKENIEQ